MEEFVWKKLAILLYQNITSIDIVITIELKFIPESKVEESRRVYKNRRRKKNFFPYPSHLGFKKGASL